ncbi:hypothetical protein HC031_07565 [Planosporangium thailandense]|uniref:Trypsin-co-occurring domain-containing protein n=1 Tax=Planosporangium thailandense TaxID=765197 RepID=A0ABX0XWL6_9ACTN|nr:CU044_2847 family protein [Planosporangium thailandense]NJC69578.1 hypothetical protein [Planosporangium thailandense]
MYERESEIVEVELPDGEVLLAEVEVLGGDVGLLDRFKLDRFAAAAQLGEVARQAVLKAVPTRPDRLGVQVGMKLVVKGGVLAGVVAETSGEASLTLTMEWDLGSDTDATGADGA